MPTPPGFFILVGRTTTFMQHVCHTGVLHLPSSTPHRTHSIRPYPGISPRNNVLPTHFRLHHHTLLTTANDYVYMRITGSLRWHGTYSPFYLTRFLAFLPYRWWVGWFSGRDTPRIHGLVYCVYRRRSLRA